MVTNLVPVSTLPAVVATLPTLLSVIAVFIGTAMPVLAAPNKAAEEPPLMQDRTSEKLEKTMPMMAFCRAI